MSESPTAAAAEPSPASRRRPGRRATLAIAAALALALVASAMWAFVVRTAGDRIAIGLIAEPQNLDIRSTPGAPLDQILIDNVYQGLIGLEVGSIDAYRPVLATALPEISDDGRKYEFEVRDDVRFASGSALTADDVVESLETTLNSGTLGDDNWAEVTASGRTVTITLDEPNNNLLWYLAGREGLIFESGDHTDLTRDTNGTGPFRFDDWERGEQLTLTRVDDYWGTEPEIDRATFRFLVDGRDAVNALHDGDVDVHTALLPSLRPEFEEDTSFRMVRAEGSDVFTLAFNSDRPPLDDPRVREALSRAIDPDAIIDSQNGDGKPLGGPIPEPEPGYEDLTSINAYDPTAARSLLAEAGQTNLSLTLTAPEFYDAAPLDLITTQLAEVGVSVRVKRVPFSAWIDEVYTNRDFQLSYVDHADARDIKRYADPRSYLGYDSERVQGLYADAIASDDIPETERLLADAARQVAEDAPAKWLYNYTPTNVIAEGVSGFPECNTNSRIPLEGISVAR